jgi:hypothetical protein
LRGEEIFHIPPYVELLASKIFGGPGSGKRLEAKMVLPKRHLLCSAKKTAFTSLFSWQVYSKLLDVTSDFRKDRTNIRRAIEGADSLRHVVASPFSGFSLQPLSVY